MLPPLVTRIGRNHFFGFKMLVFVWFTDGAPLGSRSSDEELQDPGEHLVALFEPVLESLDLHHGGLSLLGGHVGGELLHATDALEGALHAGVELFLDEGGGKFAQLQIGDVMITPVSRDVGRFYGSDAAEELESLAGGTEADIETAHDFIHRQRLRSDEKKPVNFPD